MSASYHYHRDSKVEPLLGADKMQNKNQHRVENKNKLLKESESAGNWVSPQCIPYSGDLRSEDEIRKVLSSKDQVQVLAVPSSEFMGTPLGLNVRNRNSTFRKDPISQMGSLTSTRNPASLGDGVGAYFENQVDCQRVKHHECNTIPVVKEQQSTSNADMQQTGSCVNVVAMGSLMDNQFSIVSPLNTDNLPNTISDEALFPTARDGSHLPQSDLVLGCSQDGGRMPSSQLHDHEKEGASVCDEFSASLLCNSPNRSQSYVEENLMPGVQRTASCSLFTEKDAFAARRSASSASWRPSGELGSLPPTQCFKKVNTDAGGGEGGPSLRPATTFPAQSFFRSLPLHLAEKVEKDEVVEKIALNRNGRVDRVCKGMDVSYAVAGSLEVGGDNHLGACRTIAGEEACWLRSDSLSNCDARAPPPTLRVQPKEVEGRKRINVEQRLRVCSARPTKAARRNAGEGETHTPSCQFQKLNHNNAMLQWGRQPEEEETGARARVCSHTGKDNVRVGKLQQRISGKWGKKNPYVCRRTADQQGSSCPRLSVFKGEENSKSTMGKEGSGLSQLQQEVCCSDKGDCDDADLYRLTRQKDQKDPSAFELSSCTTIKDNPKGGQSLFDDESTGEQSITRFSWESPCTPLSSCPQLVAPPFSVVACLSYPPATPEKPLKGEEQLGGVKNCTCSLRDGFGSDSGRAENDIDVIGQMKCLFSTQPATQIDEETSDRCTGAVGRWDNEEERQGLRSQPLFPYEPARMRAERRFSAGPSLMGMAATHLPATSNSPLQENARFSLKSLSNARCGNPGELASDAMRLLNPRCQDPSRGREQPSATPPRDFCRASSREVPAPSPFFAHVVAGDSFSESLSPLPKAANAAAWGSHEGSASFRGRSAVTFLSQTDDFGRVPMTQLQPAGNCYLASFRSSGVFSTPPQKCESGVRSACPQSSLAAFPGATESEIGPSQSDAVAGSRLGATLLDFPQGKTCAGRCKRKKHAQKVRTKASEPREETFTEAEVAHESSPRNLFEVLRLPSPVTKETPITCSRSYHDVFAPENFHVYYGFTNRQGYRRKQEDYVVILPEIKVSCRKLANEGTGRDSITCVLTPLTGFSGTPILAQEGNSCKILSEIKNVGGMKGHLKDIHVQHPLEESKEQSFGCFAVFDGHGGDAVSRRAARYFAKHFQMAYQEHYRLFEQECRDLAWDDDGNSSADEKPLHIGKNRTPLREKKFQRHRSRLLGAALVQALLHMDVTIYEQLYDNAGRDHRFPSTDVGSTSCVVAFYRSIGVTGNEHEALCDPRSVTTSVDAKYRIPTGSASASRSIGTVVKMDLDSSSSASSAPLAIESGAQDSPEFGCSSLSLTSKNDERPKLHSWGQVSHQKKGGASNTVAKFTLPKKFPPFAASNPCKELEKEPECGHAVRLSIANLGDCRAVVGCLSSGALLFETFDHRVRSYPSEVQRIQQSGGVVAYDRVEGCLDVTRGLGDYHFKAHPDTWWGGGPSKIKTHANLTEANSGDAHRRNSFEGSASDFTVNTCAGNLISNIADVYECDVRHHDFLIIASDGVWDHMTSADATAFVACDLRRLLLEENALSASPHLDVQEAVEIAIASHFAEPCGASSDSCQEAVHNLFINQPRKVPERVDEVKWQLPLQAGGQSNEVRSIIRSSFGTWTESQQLCEDVPPDCAQPEPPCLPLSRMPPTLTSTSAKPPVNIRHGFHDGRQTNPTDPLGSSREEVLKEEARKTQSPSSTLSRTSRNVMRHCFNDDNYRSSGIKTAKASQGSLYTSAPAFTEAEQGLSCTSLHPKPHATSSLSIGMARSVPPLDFTPTKVSGDEKISPHRLILQRAADHLAEHVLCSLNSGDNVTVIIVLFSFSQEPTHEQLGHCLHN